MTRFRAIVGIGLVVTACWFAWRQRATDSGRDLVASPAANSPRPADGKESSAADPSNGRGENGAAGRGAGASLPPPASPIRLTLRGIQPNRGTLRVAIFDSASGFPDHQHATAKESHSVGTDSQATFELSALPAGTIAIAAYQDLNDDGVLNRGSFGVPTEPYGFANDARGRFGPPTFEAASLDPSGNETANVEFELQ